MYGSLLKLFLICVFLLGKTRFMTRWKNLLQIETNFMIKNHYYFCLIDSLVVTMGGRIRHPSIKDIPSSAVRVTAY